MQREEIQASDSSLQSAHQCVRKWLVFTEKTDGLRQRGRRKIKSEANLFLKGSKTTALPPSGCRDFVKLF